MKTNEDPVREASASQREGAIAFEAFDDAARRLFAVPKKELDHKLRGWKRRKKPRRHGLQRTDN